MIEIANRTKRKFTKSELVLFKRIANSILGGKYELSLVICTDKISRHNTLAYALSKSAGEIFLNPSRKGKFSLPYLFLHSCLHLTGLDHGPKMDKLEQKFKSHLNLPFV